MLMTARMTNPAFAVDGAMDGLAALSKATCAARVTTGSGSRPASSASSRRRRRASSMVRHTRETTVVSQPPTLSTSLVSARTMRSHASWSASSASAREPSTR